MSESKTMRAILIKPGKKAKLVLMNAGRNAVMKELSGRIEQHSYLEALKGGEVVRVEVLSDVESEAKGKAESIQLGGRQYKGTVILCSWDPVKDVYGDVPVSLERFRERYEV